MFERISFLSFVLPVVLHNEGHFVFHSIVYRHIGDHACFVKAFTRYFLAGERTGWVAQDNLLPARFQLHRIHTGIIYYPIGRAAKGLYQAAVLLTMNNE